MEYDEELALEMTKDIKKIEKDLEKFEIETLPSGKYDHINFASRSRGNRSTRLGRNVI